MCSLSFISTCINKPLITEYCTVYYAWKTICLCESCKLYADVLAYTLRGSITLNCAWQTTWALISTSSKITLRRQCQIQNQFITSLIYSLHNFTNYFQVKVFQLYAVKHEHCWGAGDAYRIIAIFWGLSQASLVSLIKAWAFTLIICQDVWRIKMGFKGPYTPDKATRENQ